MNQAQQDAIRTLIAAQLGERPHRRQRQRMGVFLRTLADELESGAGHGKGGQPGRGIRWNGRDLSIGQSLWEASGRPRKIHFEFVGSTTRIISDEDGDYTVNRYGQRIGCLRAWRIGQWAKGWRPGWIEGRTICFDVEAIDQLVLDVE